MTARVTLSVVSESLGSFRESVMVEADCAAAERRRIGKAVVRLSEELSKWKRPTQGELFGKEGEAK